MITVKTETYEMFLTISESCSYSIWTKLAEYIVLRFNLRNTVFAIAWMHNWRGGGGGPKEKLKFIYK